MMHRFNLWVGRNCVCTWYRSLHFVRNPLGCALWVQTIQRYHRLKQDKKDANQTPSPPPPPPRIVIQYFVLQCFKVNFKLHHRQYKTRASRVLMLPPDPGHVELQAPSSCLHHAHHLVKYCNALQPIPLLKSFPYLHNEVPNLCHEWQSQNC